jgi:hypothetical protein
MRLAPGRGQHRSGRSPIAPAWHAPCRPARRRFPAPLCAVPMETILSAKLLHPGTHSSGGGGGSSSSSNSASSSLGGGCGACASCLPCIEAQVSGAAEVQPAVDAPPRAGGVPGTTDCLLRSTAAAAGATLLPASVSRPRAPAGLGRSVAPAACGSRCSSHRHCRRLPAWPARLCQLALSIAANALQACVVVWGGGRQAQAQAQAQQAPPPRAQRRRPSWLAADPQLCCCAVARPLQGQHRLMVYTYAPAKRNPSRWLLQEHCLSTHSLEQGQTWQHQINAHTAECADRPRNLLVLINPLSGKMAGERRCLRLSEGAQVAPAAQRTPCCSGPAAVACCGPAVCSKRLRGHRAAGARPSEPGAQRAGPPPAPCPPSPTGESVWDQHVQPVLERARVKFTAVRTLAGGHPAAARAASHCCSSTRSRGAAVAPALLGPGAWLLSARGPLAQVRTDRADHAYEMVGGMALAELAQVGGRWWLVAARAARLPCAGLPERAVGGLPERAAGGLPERAAGGCQSGLAKRAAGFSLPKRRCWLLAAGPSRQRWRWRCRAGPARARPLQPRSRLHRS